jgi:hypothetical protein
VVRLRVEKIVYFDSPEEADPEVALQAAKERAAELNLEDFVVASTSGATGLKACRIFRGFNLVVVRHQAA